MLNKLLNNQKGVTLIELLAAVVILSVIAVPMFQLLSNTFSVYIDDQRKLQAMTIAQENIEEGKNNSSWVTEGYLHSEYYKVDSSTDENYETEIFMKASSVNNVNTVKILVKVYWENTDDDNLLTFLATETRVQ